MQPRRQTEIRILKGDLTGILPGDPSPGNRVLVDEEIAELAIEAGVAEFVRDHAPLKPTRERSRRFEIKG